MNAISTSSTVLEKLGACCLALSSVLGNKVSFPGTTTYNSSLSSYFSQQNSDLHPKCIVSPTSAEDVSIAIRTLTSTPDVLDNYGGPHCHFAVRSGGHASIGGVSNIADGITIDLRGLNSININSDHTAVSVGVGATWGEVYAYLDPLGLSAAGGRAAQVGVGGLTTGGGISYLSPRYGWTCDTVSQFEVVLANGSVVEVNEKTNSNLLQALRGGSSNFGIVTRVDLGAFKQGRIWGGSVYYALDTAEEQIRAFAQLNSAEEYDEYASLITSFGYSGGQGSAVVNSIVYTKEEERPAVYEPFFKMPSLASTMRIAEMHEISMEQGSFSPDGKRQLSVVTTLVSSIAALNATYMRWNESLAPIRDVPGIVWSVSLEPLPPAIYARAASKNAMGLTGRTDALVVTLLSASWDNAADDARVEETARALFDGIEDDARRLGDYDPFLYLNYAAEWQDPIASYGKDSVHKLKRVRWEVDRRGVFQYNMPGGFKIPG
ncbi:FAD-binding oxidoreductase [Aspergillus clavatus NRRL 1]|uniref:Oxidoreductase, FAD-binding, putative n=1 Tax=Aspergillus clavatus (strain ATCC 1007 / CBS 513.65 / DSM 816 / NCTC 3887 / NRRL 1 / QM 1276 / 107) TaxID=344612 RepID=A1C798_ASPCL|nr:oxidoreductase, FAD-binding, putative [Aspergillus clavatus NRRL 1]EAW14269.1 oxidoreductase, FAD-binding, putative [Aspergillus clavatus NRRL 1]